MIKTYLVGGAVRDKLLGLPIIERDWVVVGAKPETLLQQGYQQVGQDFPVFLHPATREEYALARKERKTGSGYYGFSCDFDAAVSLEEDLLRRDLTINAMAMDEAGQLIDPYHGQQDLQNRQLRHVSPAFAEDPVRVLRVARFAARFHYLGFKVADETRQLMTRMVENGELQHFVAERVWQEWRRSLEEKNPEVFIEVLRSTGALAVIIPELDALFGVPNSVQYHPEIDSGIHTLMVFKAAIERSGDPMIRFAALVHDVGKALTPQARWPKQYGHEELGVKAIESLCNRLRVPADWRQFAVLVSRYHIFMHRGGELTASTMLNVLEKVDAFRRPQQFFNLLLVCEADNSGKGCGETVDYPPRPLWERAYEVSIRITATQMMAKGYEGKAIKEALHQARVEAIKQVLNSGKKA